MLIFAADRFVKACAELARVEQLIEIAEKRMMESGQELAVVPLKGMGEIWNDNVVHLHKQLCELNLLVSAKAAAALLEADKWGKPVSEYKTLLAHLRMSVQAEIEGIYLLHVPFNKRAYFDGKELFGADVARAFPSVIVDIEEAGKSFALERYTACVFHLMRVMEVGLRELARSLSEPSLDPKKNPSWEQILRRCDDELKKPRKERCAEWQGDDQFFSEATASLRAVKDAWRNPTMHVDISYDEDKSRDVFSTVGVFMRALARKLKEIPDWLQ